MLFSHAAIFPLCEPATKERLSLRDFRSTGRKPAWHNAHTCHFLHLFRYPGKSLSPAGHCDFCDQCPGSFCHGIPPNPVLPVTHSHHPAYRGVFCHAALLSDLHLFPAKSWTLSPPVKALDPPPGWGIRLMLSIKKSHGNRFLPPFLYLQKMRPPHPDRSPLPGLFL